MRLYQIAFYLGIFLHISSPFAHGVNILYPQGNVSSEEGVYDFGHKELNGATGKHWGYDFILDGSESLNSIQGSINAIVGPSSNDHHYNSWEILHLAGTPSTEQNYDWVFDVNLTIQSAGNPTADPDLYADTTYGIILHNYAAGDTEYNRIKEVAGSVTVTQFHGLALGDGNPAETGSEGTIYAVELGAYSDVRTLSTTVNITDATAAVGYQFNSGTRVGIEKDGSIIDGAGITGSISIHNSVNAVGILHSGTGDNNENAKEPLIGHNKAQISITSDASTPVESAIGIFVNGAGANNDILGELTGVFSGNININVHYAEHTPTQFENAAVAGIYIIQKEGYTADTKHITFGDGASVSSLYTNAGDSTKSVQYGDAIHLSTSQNNSQLNLTTENDTDTVTLTGNIRAHYDYGTTRTAQDLTFQQGNYIIAADVFEASSITLGSINPTTKLMTDASITLTESLVLNEVEHVDFYVQSFHEGSHSSITLENDATLNLSSADHINIYLGADLMEYSQYSFDLITGDVIGFEDGITFSIYDGTSTGEDALLWSFGMDEQYGTYASLATVTEHYFEVSYTENGLSLLARIPNNPPPGVPEPSTPILFFLSLALYLRARRR